jgi:hypothetical protein
MASAMNATSKCMYNNFPASSASGATIWSSAGGANINAAADLSHNFWGQPLGQQAPAIPGNTTNQGNTPCTAGYCTGTGTNGYYNVAIATGVGPR